MKFLLPLLLASLSSPLLPAQDDGFVPLFNGKDLAGWEPLNCDPTTFRAEDGMIVCTGKPTGLLRTTKTYENFVLELDWRHMVKDGNAGLFVWSDGIPALGSPFARAVEVQIMTGPKGNWYTLHGDVFPIWGAKMTPHNPRPKGGSRSFPTEERSKPSPEWNHYRVTCNNGALSLEVNGKEVTSGDAASPRKGHICLESEGSEVHFRNLRIKELPPSKNLDASLVATPGNGYRPLFGGIDLAGWKVGPKQHGHWTANNGKLSYDGKGDTIWSEESFGDFELLADWRWTGPSKKVNVPVVLPSGDYAVNEAGGRLEVEVDEAGDSGIYLRGSSKSQVNIWCWPIGSGEVYGYRTDPSMSPEVRAGVTPREAADAPLGKWNRFHITMRGDLLSVVLNGKTVIQDASLPGVAAEGPIALQHHGAPIEFANILIRKLPPPPAALHPVPRKADWWQARHKKMNETAAKGGVKMVMIGDSITQGWEGKGASIWTEFYGDRAALNLGIGGDRTQHVIWRLQNGNLEGIDPRLAVVMIGTNNSGDDSPQDIAEGVTRVTDEILARCPNAEILLLGIFPRGPGSGDARRKVTRGANQIYSKLEERDRVHYLDIGPAFLQADGTLPKSVMPDLLHLNEASYRTWAESIEPKVREILQEGVRPPAEKQKKVGYKNTPLIPGTKWHVHDSDRPNPAYVQPGVGNSPPSDAEILFDGTDLEKWASTSGVDAKWNVGAGWMQVNGSGDIQTRRSYGDCQLHIEFATPTEAAGASQGIGNSGVYLMGKYEIQILDSWSSRSYADGQAAGLYGQYPPDVNACRPPGEWQSYDIFFQAPRFSTDGESLEEPASVTVLHNGVLVHLDREFLGPTTHKRILPYKPAPTKLPLRLQDHGNPVRYRNIWIRDLSP